MFLFHGSKLITFCVMRIFVDPCVLSRIGLGSQVYKVSEPGKPGFKGLTRLRAGGGGKITPPPRFFQKAPKTTENLDPKKNISLPNSFPEILKKIACNLLQPFCHSNYVLNMGGGG